ncbi:MAG: flagellar motor protein MotB [bacterium]
MANVEDDDDEECPGGAAGWLTTWADMMSVLLTFFIVLQAFSTISEKKFFEAISSIQMAFRVPLPIRSPGQFEFATETNTAADLEEMVSDEDIAGASVQDFGDHILLSIESRFLFGLGDAKLSGDGQELMAQIAQVLKKEPGAIRVEGHTCDLPLGARNRFRDNWELSTERALTVLSALQRNGIRPERLAAAGYGEYHPIAPNDSEANRARNRRVEFVIEKKGGVSDATR